MKKLLFMVALGLAISTLGGTAFAQAAAPPAPPVAPAQLQQRANYVRPVPCILPTMRLINPLTARLNLSGDQKTKVDELLTKADADLKIKVDDQAKAAAAYVTLLTNPKTSQADLTAAAVKAMKAESDVLEQRIQTLFSLKALLTADQNKLLCDFLAQATIPWTDMVQQSRDANTKLPAAAPAQPAK